MKKTDYKKVCSYFEIPTVAEELLDFFFEEAELDFILKVGKDSFSEADVGRDFIKREYNRGLISKIDEEGKKYHLNTFYYFLDVFAVGRREQYDRLSREIKRKLDDWYFDAYLETLDKDSDVPTSDKVLPLDEMLKQIDSDDRPIYLNYCDCRTLSGDCGLPTRTCITYKHGINSFADRGLSESIDKERAKEIVKNADRAGLMHTYAMGGICNCCGDCCYLFRAQKVLSTPGRWPSSQYIVKLTPSLCVSCGKCMTRCHFGIFEKENNKITSNTAECVGCGLCVNTCPKGALKLVKRI